MTIGGYDATTAVGTMYYIPPSLREVSAANDAAIYYFAVTEKRTRLIKNWIATQNQQRFARDDNGGINEHPSLRK